MASAHGTHLRNWLFSLPPVEFVVQQLRELLIGSLKCGPIPKHIAFVMDGNRRYARANKLETVEGHHMGFEALARVLEVCYKSGVKTVTVYAFSIENFKRSKYEVDGLMDMAKTRLVQLCQHGELFQRYGASVRILGDRSLVRDDVLGQVDKAVQMTRQNDQAVLNVCFPYTSREEITHSIRETVRDYSSPASRPHPKRPFSESHIQRNIRSRQLESVAEDEEQPAAQPLMFTDKQGNAFTSDAESTDISEHDLDASSMLQPESSQTSHSPSPDMKPTSTSSTVQHRSDHLPDPESITSDILTEHTYTHPSPPLDLLIRTSGVYRLSDFMLWQCHEQTEVVFLDCLWPEFDLWKFLPVLVEWQWRQRKVAEEEHPKGRGPLVKAQ